MPIANIERLSCTERWTMKSPSISAMSSTSSTALPLMLRLPLLSKLAARSPSKDMTSKPLRLASPVMVPLRLPSSPSIKVPSTSDSDMATPPTDMPMLASSAVISQRSSSLLRLTVKRPFKWAGPKFRSASAETAKTSSPKSSNRSSEGSLVSDRVSVSSAQSITAAFAAAATPVEDNRLWLSDKLALLICASS